MTGARRLPILWLTTGTLIVLASGLDARVHAVRLALAGDGEAPIAGPVAAGGATNVALASMGAVANASSTYPGYWPAGVIDGDRSGANWGNGGGWNDETWDSFPDWVEVDFAASYSINQVNVFSVQDAFESPTEPTSTQTFSWYGLRSFEVQYWTGTAWATVPGGSVTGNTLVWRTVTFPAVTTQKIRVVVTGAADGYSRVTELEAYTNDATPPPPEPPSGTNFALASAGAVASASSTYPGYWPAGVIDGDRSGANWGNGGGWNDETWDSFPDWVEVDFAASYSINRVNVFSVQDAFESPTEPTSTQTFSWYGLRSFDVQYWTGTAWATVPGGSITGNTLVWRTVTFPAVTTQKIRVLVTAAADGYSRVTEIEAYGDGAAPPPPPPPSTADIVRFLEQSTWGPTPGLIEHVRQVGFDAFLTEQFEAPMSSYPSLPPVTTTRDTVTCPSGSVCARDNYSLYLLQNQFFRNGLYGQDQLRQRVAFALHQIIVVSGVDISLAFWYAPYLQILDRDAFGSYRNLLYDITLNPAMGNYLDVTGNTRTRPNENYGREVLQLFSIGTIKLNPDGSQQLDSTGQPIPTYSQTDVSNFARVFTGWVRAAAPGPGILNYVDPMVANQAQHDVAAKTLLNGVTLPANQSTAKDTSDAIDNIVNDPSIAPYISKSLIQHLVTSNPSPAYVARVSAVFDNDGSGNRGNLRAIVRAILLDVEARGDAKTDASYGRLRHPAQLILNLGRAFNARSRDLTTESDGVLNGQAVSMGMDVFRPPSVFSYFSPFNGVPGGGGLRGPEFGLLSTATALTRANVINTLVFSGVNVSTNAPNGTALDLAPLQALANNPTALVDSLNVLLMHGTMSAEMHNSIVNAVNAVAATNTLKRARTALYLVATSSQYQVEK